MAKTTHSLSNEFKRVDTDVFNHEPLPVVFCPRSTVLLHRLKCRELEQLIKCDVSLLLEFKQRRRSGLAHVFTADYFQPDNLTARLRESFLDASKHVSRKF